MSMGRMLKIGSLPSMKRKHHTAKYQRLVSSFLITVTIWLARAEGTSGENSANLTSVETWGDTQIKVTWEAIEDFENKPYHYELYIDNHLEYFGKDLMYVARRLTPDTVYYFKLRSCYQDRNECSDYSKTVSGVTSISRRRSFFKAFIQWVFLWVFLILLACVTAFVGVKMFRKLWRSFLYRYDYKSETNVGPKYLVNSEIIEEDVIPSLLMQSTPGNGQKTKCKNDIEVRPSSLNQKIADSKKVPKNIIPATPLEKHSGMEPVCSFRVDETAKTRSKSYIDTTSKINLAKAQNSESDKCCNNENSKNFENSEEKPHCNERCSENINIPENLNESITVEDPNNEISQNCEDHEKENFRDENVFKNGNSKPEENFKNEENSTKEDWKDEKISEKNQHHKEENFQIRNIPRNENAKDHILKISFKQIKATSTSNENELGIVVLVDNSNIFIGAQECAHAINPKERKRNIRVKIQQLVKLLERSRAVTEAFVQGSSPPTTDQVWEVYRRLGYCVDLEERRGKDEQRVDEGLHLNIYKALCELSPRKLVIASGDGNKGKSESSTSLPGCAQAALEKGWQVEVHSWQHSLSTEWLKLSMKYPAHFSIHYLDRYINYITFVDGKHGRKCQPLPTDFAIKTSSLKEITNLNSHSSIVL